MREVEQFICENYFLILSMISFVIGAGISLWRYLLEKIKKRKNEIPAAVWLTAGTALALFWLNFGYDNEIKVQAGAGTGVNTFLRAVLGVMSTFGGERAVDKTQELIIESFGEKNIALLLYADILHLAVSGVVLVVIIKIIAKFFPRLIYNVVVHFHNLYVFSGDSERDILLAENIRQLEKDKKYLFKSVMVFLKNEDDVNQKEDWLERIKAINGFVFNDTVESLYIPDKYRKKPIDFFLMKEIGDENVKNAFRVAERFSENCPDLEQKKKKNICIHILSSNPEMEYLLDSIVEKSNCEVRLISEIQSMIYQLLDKKPLYLGEKDGELNILIVGCGEKGKEAAKICSWCGYTKHLTPNIWIIDKFEENYQKLKKDCPEMVSQKNIHFEKIDVETEEFLEFLRQHKEFGYIICVLGDEHINLRTALQIRAVNYEWGPYDKKSKELPIVNVLLNNDDLNESCNELSFTIDSESEKVRSYGLNAFGSFKEFYIWDNIGSSYLEGGALAVHRFYTDSTALRDDFYETYKGSNYNRMSSMATALHAKYKVYTLMYEILPNKYTSEMKDMVTNVSISELVKLFFGAASDEERNEISQYVDELAEVEYLRWNAYMRANGWRAVKNDQYTEWEPFLNTRKNIPAKLHPLVGKWNPGDARGGVKVDTSDKKLIWNLPFILEDAEKFDDFIYNHKKQYDVDTESCGNYTWDDFEAMTYWYKRPIQKGDKVFLYGSKKKIKAYLNQALLMHVFLENPPSFEIYSDDFTINDFDLSANDFVLHQVSAAEIIVKSIQECKDEEEVIKVDELLKNGEVTEYAVKELRYEIIEKAKAINEAYNEQNKKYRKEWMELNSFTKGSNICSAAFSKMHRENYANGMEFCKMSEIEHIRWCRYHLLHGWRYGNPLDADKKPIPFSKQEFDKAYKNAKNKDVGGKSLIITKNADEKWHTCLVSYADLEIVKYINPNVIQNDKTAVEISISTIAQKKNQEEEEGKNE